ncbi:ABC transporter CDR4 [Cytospora mali]|uniref:ABC transporter CDR4 n=1 Tax=Cytospora mali TaxID=578113 RepID=A0A194UUW7_CYTMA|nr:ABC transporter CDR4 [Valsa mali var. pyri (nom. inval.)]
MEKESSAAVSKAVESFLDGATIKGPTSTEMKPSEAEALRRLATTFCQRSGAGCQLADLSQVSFDEDNSSLAPSSKAFDPAKWAQSIVCEIEARGIRPARTGIMFKELTVFGTGDAVQTQRTVDSVLAGPLRPGQFLHLGKKAPKSILSNFDGVLGSGELLIVLGRPGSGCSTLLKTMCGELNGLSLDKDSIISYDGIPQHQMQKEFKGEAIYNQEVDKHFPHLTVGQTLEFAAAVRTPADRFGGMSRSEFSKLMAQVTMAICGLTHTANTKVGNEFVRGVSIGERKRVSIAEMMLAGSPFSAWDNSTRGLDSSNALKFVQTLRLFSDIFGAAHAVAVYQASQAIYDLFDKATVLYEGRQIYYGPAKEAKAFFERQGWYCAPRQFTGDFLTSVTNPSERKPREGMENKVPRTPEEFEMYWRSSPEFQKLKVNMTTYAQEYPMCANMDVRTRRPSETQNETLKEFRETKSRRKARLARRGSPYILSFRQQIGINTKRAYQRIWGDKLSHVFNAVMQLITALVIGSMFFGPSTYNSTVSFISKGPAVFIALLSNALTSVSEINTLYAQRPIVEKHVSFAFYHPAAEALAGIVASIPVKLVIAICFNPALYFLANLRREPGNFFLFFLVMYLVTFVFAGIFHTVAAATKHSAHAMTIASVLILALTIYTGFMISVPQMHPWFSWIRWIDPLYYAFEILVANEFHGREYICASIIPSYTPLVGDSWVCNAIGAVPGRPTVNGDAFIAANYKYYYSHVWRNLGILIGFLIFFAIVYVITSELNSSMSSPPQFLIYKRGHVPAYPPDKGTYVDNSKEIRPCVDVTPEPGTNRSVPRPPENIFTWKDVAYDIKVNGETRRLLDNVSGWVKPGTLTMLMGVSGAGKTTLLDVLAQRTTTGVITGGMLVNGKPLQESFQRRTGYVQHQDLHLETATVRESLRFSAMLRQPKSVSKAEKYQFVEEVIEMLNMGDFADAVVGVPGVCLNVEQRKLLTIGVELVARPKLLLFLDEPTSGLDSQSSWAIVAFLRKLANAGQAILCTIHQPSATLFQEFDRLLFLTEGGKTSYFGDIGENSKTLLDYCESNGARKCGPQENPAEYIIEVASGQTPDWHSAWLSSPERKAIEAEIDRFTVEKSHEAEADDPGCHSEFAMPFSQQLVSVTTRVFQQYWRMPSYIFAKFTLGLATGIFIGFSFWRRGGTLGGMHNVIVAIFQVVTPFAAIVQQMQPSFLTQRSLYELREQPSKTYSWKAFMIANIIVEIPYQIVTGTLIWASFYYPVVGAGQDSESQGLVWLLTVVLLIYGSTFAQMTIAALPDATTAGSLVTLLMLMSLMFCGVLQVPVALSGFWTFMYRASPFTYWLSAMTSTMLHNRAVTCNEHEAVFIDPPAGETCGEYFAAYLSGEGSAGALQNPNDTSACRYCPYTVADQYLAGSDIYWIDRWRNFGLLWAYIGFNVMVAIGTYYLFRVRPAKRSRVPKGKKI